MEIPDIRNDRLSADKITYKRRYMISVYSAVHFMVDFACAFLLFRHMAGMADWYLYILLYNFFAFAGQMPLGVIADKLNKNYLFAAAGCVLLALSYGLWSLPAAAVVLLGTGNALFHIGGGIDILNISGKKSAALGIFVSPGAFGVYFGTLCGKANSMPFMLVPALLLVAALVIIFIRRMQGGEYPDNAKFSLKSAVPHKALVIAACLFWVVCLRSYLGLSFNFAWKTVGFWGVAAVCAVAFGKAAGGFLADKFGMLKTAAASLGLAALLYLFSLAPLPGVAAAFMFNMTMPITLWLMAKIFPGAKGFSFGLLTFGLFLGFLPAYLGLEPPPGAAWFFALGALVSLVLLLFGLRKAKI